MKIIILAFTILTSCLSPVYAKDELNQYELNDGYDFELKCAHGNYQISLVNFGLCTTVIRQSAAAVIMVLAEKYNESTLKCYWNIYDLDNQTNLMGIKRLENYYTKHPEFLKNEIVHAYYVSFINKYPIPEKCLLKE
ncbi:TPA: hypothetical protein JBJ69_14635 [Legionella pneumophila]|nr:hypothetical protein [Legionella pneumophila]